MSALPRIAVIGCGGTISSQGASSLDVLDYPDFGKKLPVAQVLEKFPETRLVADIQAQDFRSVGSTAIGPDDWLALRALIHQLAAADPAPAGFVIPHGTATIEETAWFLNLTLNIKQTVVVVGAQRPSSALSTDAGMNLVAALKVAGAPEARGLGVLVVMNDEIHAARDVMKTSTYRLQTFRSPDFGALGHVDGDGIRLFRAPLRRHAPDTEFAALGEIKFPRVDIVTSYAGADGTLIDAVIAAGAKGLVHAGLAPGIPTPGEKLAIARALETGIKVVQSSRAASGRVGHRRSFGETGIIPAGDFSPAKARILLGLMLAVTNDHAAIVKAFDVY